MSYFDPLSQMGDAGVSNGYNYDSTSYTDWNVGGNRWDQPTTTSSPWDNVAQNNPWSNVATTDTTDTTVSGWGAADIVDTNQTWSATVVDGAVPNTQTTEPIVENGWGAVTNDWNTTMNTVDSQNQQTIEAVVEQPIDNNAKMESELNNNINNLTTGESDFVQQIKMQQQEKELAELAAAETAKANRRVQVDPLSSMINESTTNNNSQINGVMTQQQVYDPLAEMTTVNNLGMGTSTAPAIPVTQTWTSANNWGESWNNNGYEQDDPDEFDPVKANKIAAEKARAEEQQRLEYELQQAEYATQSNNLNGAPNEPLEAEETHEEVVNEEMAELKQMQAIQMQRLQQMQEQQLIEESRKPKKNLYGNDEEISILAMIENNSRDKKYDIIENIDESLYPSIEQTLSFIYCQDPDFYSLFTSYLSANFIQKNTVEEEGDQNKQNDNSENTQQDESNNIEQSVESTLNAQTNKKENKKSKKEKKDNTPATEDMQQNSQKDTAKESDNKSSEEIMKNTNGFSSALDSEIIVKRRRLLESKERAATLYHELTRLHSNIELQKKLPKEIAAIVNKADTQMSFGASELALPSINMHILSEREWKDAKAELTMITEKEEIKTVIDRIKESMGVLSAEQIRECFVILLDEKLREELWTLICLDIIEVEKEDIILSVLGKAEKTKLIGIKEKLIHNQTTPQQIKK